MAKAKEKPIDNEDIFDNSGIEESKYGSAGGMTNARILAYAEDMDAIQAQMDTKRGELGAVVKAFEDAGGNKLALKFARRLANMEKNKLEDFWNSVLTYLDVLGVSEQLELFAEPVNKPTQIVKTADATDLILANGVQH